MDLSIIIPTYNEEKNIYKLILKIEETLNEMEINSEIIIIDGNSKDNTCKNALKAGAKVIYQKTKGYGNALIEGFKNALGKYIVTMDADFSHLPLVIKNLWAERNNADIIIASRYVKKGKSEVSFLRQKLSIILNKIFTYCLSLPLKDISSGFRMYKKEVIDLINIKSKNYDILEEIIIKIYGMGFKIKEIPFHYKPRKYGTSKAKIIKFGFIYLKTLYKMWVLRNSITFADYEERAFNSRIPLQRYWQRKKYYIITKFLENTDGNFLDIGCGSSKITQNSKAIGLDIEINKLRYIKNINCDKLLINGNVYYLPFKSNSFKRIICSEIIEHLNEEEKFFKEINRVLMPKGFIIIITPDYDKLIWRIIEFFYKLILPYGYVDKHITHYTFKSLINKLSYFNLEIMQYQYIWNAELIIKVKKN